jgi:serine/threonine protein kinase
VSAESLTVRAEEVTASAERLTTKSELVLERYRLLRILGTGGFATVWAAHDERLERDVAVKVIQRELVSFARFEREARAAARLTHPAIVTLYEAAIDANGAYLVSELVRGRGLDQLLVAGRCSDRDILEISISVADALAYAHSEGVIHRDVKPSNVLVPARPAVAGGAAAKLTDFGVAFLLDEGRAESLTRTGDVIGTANYMAPEQARGREATVAVDLYSLALLIYEALTGVNPLRGAPAGRRRPPAYLPPLRRQRRDLPDALGRAIDTALHPRPQERGGINELRDVLEASVEHAGIRPGIVSPRGWLSGRRGLDDRAPPRAHDAGSISAAARVPSGAGSVDVEPRAAGTPAGGTWDQRGLRALAAVFAAFTVWWLTRHLLSTPPLVPTAAAAVTALAAVLAPRLGFLFAAGLVIGIAAFTGSPGAAVLLAVVVAFTAAAMPGRGAMWGLPGGAVLLGTVSLAGAWPAVAARSGARLWLRAAASGVGFIWLAAAGALAGAPLYEHVWPQPPPPASWTSSPALTVHGVLEAMVHSGIVGGAVVWAIAAAVGPPIVRGRSPALAAALAIAWAGVTVLCTALATRALAGAHANLLPRGAVAGAILGAVVIAAPVLARRGRPTGVGREVP